MIEFAFSNSEFWRKILEGIWDFQQQKRRKSKNKMKGYEVIGRNSRFLEIDDDELGCQKQDMVR